MKALALIPFKRGSATILDVPEPPLSDGSLLVEMIAVGVCGTDREIMAGQYGRAPKDKEYLILGHESLGRVLEAPENSGFNVGDHVVGIVRRPDPVPCENCAILEWDMCKNGLYTERGIKERNGYCSERFRLEPEFAIRVDRELGDSAVLLEPASVVAKAWDHIERIGRRALFHPKKILITGAGPIGLLAALMGSQRGLEVHVVDQIREGLKPELVRQLGAIYHPDSRDIMHLRNTFDVAIECTGAGPLVLDVICTAGPNSVVCLAGLSSGGRKIELDVAGLNRNVVLENGVVFGTVNANRRHYEQAALSLGRADRDWLSRLITRRIPLARWEEMLRPGLSDIKMVLVPS